MFELLTITDQIQKLITQRATAAEIRIAAIQQGMRPMRLDGIAKAIASHTTLDEVARVTVDTAEFL